MEQVLVLLDARAGDTPFDMNTVGDQQTNAEIIWTVLCPGDCLSVEDLCVALSSGFDRVYLQLSADITRLNGQLQLVEAASARLRPGQVVRLFHSVDGLLGGWAEPSCTRWRVPSIPVLCAKQNWPFPAQTAPIAANAPGSAPRARCTTATACSALRTPPALLAVSAWPHAPRARYAWWAKT